MTMKQGKKVISCSGGWFTYFFHCLEEASNKAITPEKYLGKELGGLVLLFQEFDYRTNQKLCRQPFTLFFAVLNLINIKYDTGEKNVKPLCPFLYWGNDQVFNLHINPMFLSTIMTMIFFQTYKRTPIMDTQSYRAMMTDPIRGQMLSVATRDLLQFQRKIGDVINPYSHERMLLVQVNYLYLLLFTYYFNSCCWCIQTFMISFCNFPPPHTYTPIRVVTSDQSSYTSSTSNQYNIIDLVEDGDDDNQHRPPLKKVKKGSVPIVESARARSKSTNSREPSSPRNIPAGDDVGVTQEDLTSGNNIFDGIIGSQDDEQQEEE